MLKEERQKTILEKLNQEDKVLTAELCRLLNVSLDTVRRDLNELEEEGRLIKVHGGAISRSYSIPFQQQHIYKQEEKALIAAKAVELIEEGMDIFLGGGTIMLELAKLIPEKIKLKIFTISPLVALEITQRTGMNVELLGGTVFRESYICTGAEVIRKFSEIKADLSFLGTNGISVNSGVTEKDYEVALVKKAMIASANKNVVMSLSERIGEEKKFKVCNNTEIDYLISELPLDKAWNKFPENICRL